LLGYASGYSSEAFGADIQFQGLEPAQETNDRWYFVGKKAIDFGDFPPEKIETDPISFQDKLDRAHKKIEQQNAELRLNNVLNERLNEIVLHGNGLDEIAKTIDRKST